MMGILTAQQRHILLDIVTAIVMQDAYSLKRTVLKAFPIVGSVGYVVSIFFAYSLYKNMKKGK